MDKIQNNCAKWKKARRKRTIYCMISFRWILENTNQSQQQISGGDGRGGMGRDGWGNSNKYEETFVGDGYIHCIDCGSSFTGV